MIEAVNSALANSVVARGEVAQASTANSYVANPGRIQQVAPAPYLSTKIRLDNEFDRAILEFREAETGDVISQTPTKQQLQAYRQSSTDATITVQDARLAQTSHPEVQAAPAPETVNTGGTTEAKAVNTSTEA